MRKILVAEDDILLATIHEITLSEAGFDVLVCRDGEQALAAMDAFDPDMLITDFSMPRMNGGELADAVLAMRPALPILVATGYADLPPGKGMELPRLSKPYSQQQLAAQIALLAAS